jgi:signal transduction histidine kinase
MTLVDIDAHAAARTSVQSELELQSMRERIDQFGGECDIQFTDHGTGVQVRVPLQEGNR